MTVKVPFVDLCHLKRAFYLITAALVAGMQVGYTQVTITASNVTSGDTVMYRGIDDSPDSTINPGPTGLNTWNFSALVNDGLDTLSFVDPASTPYGWKFPTASMCMANKDGYTYFRKVASRFALVGSALDFIGNETLLPVKAIPELTFIPFPSTYLTAYNDLATFGEVLAAEDVNANSYDSLFISGTLQTYVSFDAYGTMITPFDTMNVIRQRINEVLDYTVTGKKYFLGQVLYSTMLISEMLTETQYLWWSDSAGVNYPVVEMQLNPGGSVNSVRFAVAMNVKVGEGIVTDCHDSCDAAVEVLGVDSSYSYVWSDPDTQTTSAATGLCEGSFRVLVTDSNGSYVRIPFSVANATEVTAGLQGFGASCETCADGGAHITISGGTAPYAVLWDSSAGFQTMLVASDLKPGTYTVLVTDNNACEKLFTTAVGLFKGVKVYPNPANELITIFTRIDGQMELQIFDLAGRLLRAYQYSESEAIIRVSTLPEGHYIYRLVDESGTELKSDHFSIIRP
jgi:hypothetical protein